MTGIIFDIKEMAVHDGPGLRTTVFFKGCPLRCRWCHNPEGLTSSPQLMYKKVRCTGCGSCRMPCDHEACRPFGRCIRRCPGNRLEVTGRTLCAVDLAAELKQTADVLGDNFGGVTFSGGEPLFQPAFLLETADRLKEHHLCLETSGYADAAVFRAAVEKMDCIIMDIKLADGDLHRKYTGRDNAPILQNLAYLKSSGKPHLIRTPLIPGITDAEENLQTIRRIIGDSPWEQLPCNPLAGAKYEMLSMEFPMKKV